MPGFVKLHLEVYEVVKHIALMLLVFLYRDSTTEDLFCRAPAWYKTCLPAVPKPWSEGGSG